MYIYEVRFIIIDVNYVYNNFDVIYLIVIVYCYNNKLVMCKFFVIKGFSCS